MGTTRKPHNDYAGYVTEYRHPKGGHIIIIDRENGGDWIDADGRWLVLRETRDGGIIGPTFASLTKARAFVCDERNGTSGYVWR